jgi:outer membrane protein TolC
MTLDEAVETALRQRLDFATVRDRLADAERAVAIAEDDMRMKLDVSASATASSPTRNRISTPRFADADYSVGLDVDLPLDRTDEAIALKRAQIALEQQRRQIDASSPPLYCAILFGSWKEGNHGDSERHPAI